MHALTLLAVLTFCGFSEKPTIEFDVVEVISGRTTPGKDSIAADHGRFVYWFATEQNRETFRRNPGRYQIQLGGACARMGPLSGSCRNDIYAVHDGKIYLFASTQCRDGFLKSPEKLLETDEPPIQAAADAQKKGRELLNRAARAIGPTEKLAALKTYRETIAKDPADKSESEPSLRVWTWQFPESYRSDESWGKSTYSMFVVGNDGRFIYPNESWEMASAQADALRRQSARHPLALLANRNQPGFTCAAAGRGMIAGADAELVTVNFDGATTTIGIDPGSGRIIATRHRDRGGPRATLGEVEKRYSDFREVDGLTLPYVIRCATFDGAPLDGKPSMLSAIEVNPALDDAAFRSPR